MIKCPTLDLTLSTKTNDTLSLNYFISFTEPLNQSMCMLKNIEGRYCLETYFVNMAYLNNLIYTENNGSCDTDSCLIQLHQYVCEA